jgi:regulator of sigma E protease
MNFIFGAIVVFLLVSQSYGFVGTTVKGLVDGFPLAGENGLMVGDTITEINGEKLYYVSDFSLFMTMAGGKPVDMTVLRDGKSVTLTDLPLKQQEYTIDGEKQVRYGITFNQIEGSSGEKFKYSVYTTANYVRLVRVSLVQLFSGSYGLRDLSGPVGIVSVINQVGQSDAASTAEKLMSIANFAALIAVNLAVMNMLPIPALDGGRIFFMLVTYVIEKISRRHVDPKYEGYIHTAGFVLLLGLMCVIMVNDVVKIING